MRGASSDQGLAQALEIAALQAEVEQLHADLNAKLDAAVAADFDILARAISDTEQETVARLLREHAAERTRSTLAMAGWKEMERQFRAAEADVRALAEALLGVKERVAGDGPCWCLYSSDLDILHSSPCLGARAALEGRDEST